MPVVETVPMGSSGVNVFMILVTDIAPYSGSFEMHAFNMDTEASLILCPIGARAATKVFGTSLNK